MPVRVDGLRNGLPNCVASPSSEYGTGVDTYKRAEASGSNSESAPCDAPDLRAENHTVANEGLRRQDIYFC
jgi:hypothetical protein